jgi:hypothetical protein
MQMELQHLMAIVLDGKIDPKGAADAQKKLASGPTAPVAISLFRCIKVAEWLGVIAQLAAFAALIELYIFAKVVLSV